MGSDPRLACRPLLWWAATFELTVAGLPLVDPDLRILQSVAYAQVLPFVPLLVIASLAGGAAALLSALGAVPQRWVPAAIAVVCAPIAGLAVVFFASGIALGWIAYGVVLVVLAYTAVSLWRGVAMPLRPFVAMVASMQILQGVAMSVTPGAFGDRAIYGELPVFIGLIAPSFVLAGSGMLVAETLRRKRMLLAFASLAALDLLALVSVFTSTGLWTETVAYGVMAVLLLVAVPWRPSLYEAPVAIASIAAALALWDVGGRGLPAVGVVVMEPSAAMMAPPAGLVLFAAAAGLATCFGTSRRWPRIAAAALGVSGMAVAVSALPAAIAGTIDPYALTGRAAGVAEAAGPAALVLAALACGSLVALASRPRLAATHFLVLAVAVLMLTVGLAGLFPYALDAPALLTVYGAGAMRLHGAMGVLILAIACLLWATPRIAAGPVGLRVFAGLGALVVVAAVRAFVNARAIDLLAAIPAGTVATFEVVDAAKDSAALLSALAIVAVGWTGILLTRTVTDPLAELAAAIRRSNSGEARVRLESERADEIGDVMRGFDRLSSNVADANDALVSQSVRLATLNERYRAILKRQGDLGDAVVVLEDGRPIEWTPALNVLTGLDDAALRELPDLFEVIGEERRADVRRLAGPAATSVFRFDAPVRRPDGSRIDIQVAGGRIGSNGHVRQMAVIRDVTERKRAERELERLALYDRLTGLPNRTLLRDRLERAVRAASHAGDSFGILYLDLDRFKEVNDALGHDVGDRILREVADRLRATIDPADTLARPGGDELVVIHPASGDSEALVVLAYRVGEALRPPVTIGEHVVYVDASIGIVGFPRHGVDAEALLRHAESAMYEAKRGRRTWALYEAEDDGPARDRVALLAELRAAVEHEELELHFQPQIALRGRHGSAAVEALVRWRHPERGLLLPSDFIPLAEESGIVEPLSRWVLREALAACATWRADGRTAPVAVNLSMRSAPGPELVATVLSDVARVGLDPSALVLEVTESWMMLEPERTEQVLTDLASTGVRISVDDFGTGYSSLVYLQRLPVHELKVDLRFVRAMLSDAASDAIVRSVVGLGHALGLTVVAEGVEDDATAQALADLGCDIAQGFAVARPMPLGELREWLAERDRARGPGLAA